MHAVSLDLFGRRAAIATDGCGAGGPRRATLANPEICRMTMIVAEHQPRRKCPPVAGIWPRLVRRVAAKEDSHITINLSEVTTSIATPPLPAHLPLDRLAADGQRHGQRSRRCRQAEMYLLDEPRSLGMVAAREVIC